MLAKLVAQHSQTLSSTRCIIQAALKPLKKKKKTPCPHSKYFPQTSRNATEPPVARVSIKMHLVNRTACLYKYELVVVPPPPLLSKSWSLPSASIRDCLGYSPLCPHTVSSSATCSPVYPTRLFALPHLTLFS